MTAIPSISADVSDESKLRGCSETIKDLREARVNELETTIELEKDKEKKLKGHLGTLISNSPNLEHEYRQQMSYATKYNPVADKYIAFDPSQATYNRVHASKNFGFSHEKREEFEITKDAAVQTIADIKKHYLARARAEVELPYLKAEQKKCGENPATERIMKGIGGFLETRKEIDEGVKGHIEKTGFGKKEKE